MFKDLQEWWISTWYRLVWWFEYTWIGVRISKLKYWFLHRFHPNHRYHMLRLGPPGYRDPDHRMMLAVIRCFEVYVDQLRSYYQDEDLSGYSYSGVLKRYAEYWAKEVNGPTPEYEDPKGHQRYAISRTNYFSDLYHIMAWWEGVKDSDYLDCFGDGEEKYYLDLLPEGERFEDLTWDEVNRKLTKLISYRRFMWT